MNVPSHTQKSTAALVLLFACLLHRAVVQAEYESNVTSTSLEDLAAYVESTVPPMPSPPWCSFTVVGSVNPRTNLSTVVSATATCVGVGSQRVALRGGSAIAPFAKSWPAPITFTEGGESSSIGIKDTIGLTIWNSSFTGLYNGNDLAGAALIIDNSTVGLQGVKISRCRSNTVTGALKLVDSTAEIVSSQFVNNTGHAAVHAMSSVQPTGAKVINRKVSLDVMNSLFWGNIGNLQNAAIFDSSKKDVLVSDSFFIRNTAFSGGSAIRVFNCSNATLEIDNCLFAFNNATSGKAGAVSADVCPLQLSNCLFDNNTAISGAGALYLYSLLRRSTVAGTRFVNNYGGALGSGGAVQCLNSPAPLVLEDNLYERNTGFFGGAVNVELTNYTIATSTFDSNSALAYGGGVSVDTANGTIEDCRFTANSAKQLGGAIFQTSGQGDIARTTATGNTLPVLYRLSYSGSIVDTNIPQTDRRVVNSGAT